jgi:peptidoglycan/LPS O-acetylase OafA/YrhL
VSVGVEDRARVGGLDGLRAIAVIAVVVYHLWPDRLPAGFLGVDLFMVLSGFLITGLLVDERTRSGAIRLVAFWIRRFRRLVPALLALLAGVAVWVSIVGPDTLEPTVRGQGAASLLYVGNWKLVHDGTSYATLSSSPSPLLHLWSLAIEEQFYVIWPLVVVGVLLLARGRLRPLVMVAAAGAATSAALMALWFDPHRDPLRLYYGTDTRAQAFLIGALAAIAARRFDSEASSRRLQFASVPALIGVLAAFALLDTPSTLYRGGFGVFAVVAAVVVVAVTRPGPVAAALDRGPLRTIGRVSYGIYLWHWPVIVLVTKDTSPFAGPALLAVRVALISALTAASWMLVERPYKHAARTLALPLAPIGIAAAAVALFALPSRQVAAYADFDVSAPPASIVDATPALSTPAQTPSRIAALATATPASAAPVTTAAPPTTALTDLPQPKTVLVIGDSGTYDAAPALVAGFAAAGTRLVSTAYPGEGLSRPDGVQDMWSTAIDKYQPDLIVVGLGTWDSDFVVSHGWAAYDALVNTTVARLTRGGAHVLWLSVFPSEQILPDARDRAGAQDRMFAALPSRYPDLIDYFDIGPALETRDGQAPRVVDGRLLRKPDGFHLCPDGAAAIAHAVLNHLGLDRDGWDQGGWRRDARYDNPHNGCAG